MSDNSIHSLQVNTFLIRFEIGVCWVSITSSLIAGEEKKKQIRCIRMGERHMLKIYVPSRGSLRVLNSANLASSVVGDV